MNAEAALTLVNQILAAQSKQLNRTQERILLYSWEEQTYQQIADQIGYDSDYIRELGAEIWQMLSTSLGMRVSKKNLTSVLSRYHQQLTVKTNKPPIHDWGDAEDVSIFCGRLSELTQLETWILSERVRAIAILGMEGIGKTAFAITLAEEIQTNFEQIIWRRLHHNPVHTLTDLTHSLKITSSSPSQDLTLIIDHLRRHRCLIILDQAEITVTDHGEILRRIASTQHQSCLILVSRLQPQTFALLEGEKVRSLFLAELTPPDCRELFSTRGNFHGSEAEWQSLFEIYGGNPLILNLVASSAKQLFNGAIAPLIQLYHQQSWLPQPVCQVLAPHLNQLSPPERQVVNWISLQGKLPLPLQQNLATELNINPVNQIWSILEVLQQRGLLYRNPDYWYLSPVITAYLRHEQAQKADPSHN